MWLGEKIRTLFKQAEPATTDKTPTLDETGWAESLIYSSADWPKYNPDDLLTSKGFKVYRQMLNDEQVKAVTKFKRDAITSRQWYFDVDEQDSAMEERRDVLEAIIDKMPGSFTDSINGIMSAMYHGFSMTEKVHQVIDVEGKSWVGLKKLALKPFDSFKFHTDVFGNVLKITQCWENQEQEIAIEKFIHHVINKDYDAHYGRSDLREAYRAWFSKEMAIRMYNIYLERSAAGFIYVTPKDDTNVNVNSTEYTNLKLMLQNIQTKTSIILPKGYELNVHSPTATTAYIDAIAMHDKAIAKALLVPNLLGISEQGQTGSYSQSQTQLEAFLWTLDAEALRLEETLNEQLFKELSVLNWGDEDFPRFKFKPVSETMKFNLVRVWKDLIQSGAVQHTDTDEAHVREILNFPDAGEPVNKPIMNPMLPPGTDGTQPASGNPDNEDQPKDEEGTSPDLPDETVVGKGVLKSSKAYAITRAERRVDFAVIDKTTNDILASATDKATYIFADAVKEIKKIIEKENILTTSKVDAITVPASVKSSMKAAFERALRESWAIGQRHGMKEIDKAKGKKFAVDNIQVSQAAADKFLESRAYTMTGDLFAGTEKKVTTIMYNAIKGSWSLTDVFDAIDEELGASVIPNLSTVIRTTMFEAINEARYEIFSDPSLDGFVEALEYSATLDDRTTDICQSLDGKIYPTDSDVWDIYTPPNHFNCRSIVIPVTELDNWKESKPPTVDPMDGFA